jgi:hypothetical protein
VLHWLKASSLAPELIHKRAVAYAIGGLSGNGYRIFDQNVFVPFVYKDAEAGGARVVFGSFAVSRIPEFCGGGTVHSVAVSDPGVCLHTGDKPSNVAAIASTYLKRFLYNRPDINGRYSAGVTPGSEVSTPDYVTSRHDSGTLEYYDMNTLLGTHLPITHETAVKYVLDTLGDALIGVMRKERYRFMTGFDINPRKSMPFGPGVRRTRVGALAAMMHRLKKRADAERVINPLRPICCYPELHYPGGEVSDGANYTYTDVAVTCGRGYENTNSGNVCSQFTVVSKQDIHLGLVSSGALVESLHRNRDEIIRLNSREAEVRNVTLFGLMRQTAPLHTPQGNMVFFNGGLYDEP